MRHLWSLLAGLVAAPLTWALLALGQRGSQETVAGWVQRDAFDTVDLIEPASYLAAAGIMVGLIAVLRLSPLGPLVAGLLFAALYVGMFITPLTVRDAVPDTWAIQDRQLLLLGPLDNGTLLFVGLLLVMAVFSPQRWRGRPTPAAGGPDAPAEPAAPEATDRPGEPVGVGSLTWSAEPSSAAASSWPTPAPAGTQAELPRRTSGSTEPAIPHSDPEQSRAGASPWAAPPPPRPESG